MGTAAGGVRPALPPARTAVFGAGALALLSGLGVVAWALPVAPALGTPGAFVEAPATATDVAGRRVSNSPTLASDPTAPRVVALAHRLDGPQPGCGLQVSSDGGEGWVGADPVPALPPGVERCADPEAAFDGRGTLYYRFAGLAGPDMRPVGIFLATSTDRGRSFSAPRQVLGPLAYGVRMAADTLTGRLHLAWLQAEREPSATGFTSPANTVLAASSDDGGATWSEPVALSGPPGGRLAAPVLAVGPQGRVVVAYYDLGDDARDYEGRPGPIWDGRWRLLTATSTDGGASFRPSEVVEGEVVPAARVPSIFTMAPPALATGRQRTCVAWTDGRHGDADVLLRCAGPDGRWRPAKRVNDDTVGNGISQHLPQLALAPNGRIDVAFYDRRTDQRNGRTTVGYAYSYDGAEFSGSVALTRIFFDATVGLRPAAGQAGVPADLGSRLGVLSEGSSALIAWADTRNAPSGVVAQDVYTAQATLLFTSERPAWALPAGLALAAVGAATMWRLRSRQAL